MGEGTNNQIEQGNGAISNPDNPPKKKTCNLTKILIGCAVAYISGIIITPVVEIEVVDEMFFVIVEILFFAVLVAMPFLAIISLIRINLKSDILKGRIISFLILVISSFFIYIGAYYEVPRAKRYPYMCGTNLKGLGVAFTVYANDYDDHIPSDNWCDLLILEADVSPRSYRCGNSDSVEGESDFCLNKYVAGQEISLFPAKTVLMFEAIFEPAENEKRQPISKRDNFEAIADFIYSFDGKVYMNRWNQVGGPEMLDTSRHKDGCHILFVDGRSEFVKHSELSNLRWNLEGDISFDMSRLESKEPTSKFVYTKNLLNILAIVTLGLTGFIVFKYGTAKYWVFILLTGILSAGTGAFFGNMSEEAYISYGQTGLHAGIHYGLLVGLCYAVLMIHWLKKLYPLKTIVGFASSVGMVTGIICAALVHIVLIIVNEETNCFGIIIGIPYGTFAGAILGAISGLILKKTYKAQQIIENAEEGATQ